MRPSPTAIHLHPDDVSPVAGGVWYPGLAVRVARENRSTNDEAGRKLRGLRPTDPDLRSGTADGRPAAGDIPRARAFPRVDAGVLEGVRRGDPTALGEFFDLFFDRIYGLAYTLLGDRALAEDASQEVCYRIQKGAHRLDPGRDPSPWVLASTVNACRSIWRSAAQRMRRESVSIEATGSEFDAPDPALGPDEHLLAREREQWVRRALAGLEESLREVVLLHDYEGLDHKEIASVLEISHEAARKRYSRALAEMAARLRTVMK